MCVGVVCFKILIISCFSTFIPFLSILHLQLVYVSYVVEPVLP
jgi:hypothetical protein